jgi:4-amino-4-deoxy-L-arabinose transferase-like glycosyltransferase
MIRLRQMARQHAAFAVITTLFVALTQVYSLLIPAYEGPDQTEHVAYILLVRQNGRLPDPLTDFETPVKQEASQPPLYYLTAALFSHLLPHDYANLQVEPATNPWRGLGDPQDIFDNRNTFLMNPAGHIMTPELRAQVDGVYGLRLLSPIYGILALWAVYSGALTLWPGERRFALLAVILFAFTPQILHAYANVSNDVAVFTFGALALTAALHLRRRPGSLAWAGVSGLLVGLAMLSKANGLTLLIVPLAALAVAWRGGSLNRRALIRQAAIVLMVAFVAGGFWYARSLLLYGDLDGSSTHIQMPWATNSPLTAGDVLSRLSVTLVSTWADLGWGSIFLPPAAYVVPLLFIVTALIGWWRTRLTGDAVVLLAALAVGLAGVFYWMTISTYVPGRLILHLYAAVVWLVVWGWRRFEPRLYRSLSVISAALVLMQAAYTPFVLYEAFFPVATQADSPNDLIGVPLTFANDAQFTGYRIDDDRAVDGAERWLTLCWRAPDGQPLEVPFAFALHLVGDGDVRLAARDSYPGYGRFTRWPSGRSFCERFRYAINGPLEPARVYPLRLKLYDPETFAEVASVNPSGWQDNRIGFLRSPAPQIESAALADALATFSSAPDGQIALLSAQIYSGTLSLRWAVQGTAPGRPLSVLVHLLDSSGQLAAQADTVLGGDRYPSWAWSSGESVEQVIPLPLDALDSGDHALVIGVYEPESFMRLNVTGADGLVTADNTVEIARIRTP